MSRVRKEATGCWTWIGSVKPNGYGVFSPKHAEILHAHRWSYEHFTGPIPEGLQIDHLCKNTRCVNPDHLEVVTHTENMRRGGVRPQNTPQPFCGRGHPMSGDNLKIVRGRRYCRACGNIRSHEYRARQKGPLFGLGTAGERNGAHKLTWDDVRDIRARCVRGELQREVAAEYGVLQSNVSQIVRHVTWKEKD